MAVCLAETAGWQNADDLITWLQSKKELNVAEFRDAGDAFTRFRHQRGLDFTKEDTARELILTLAFRRYSELREDRDLHGISEFLEADYASGLTLRIMPNLADGKDEEFSARVFYQAVDSRTWTLPTKGFSHPYNEARWDLFDKLMGKSEPTVQRWTMDSTDGRNAVKRALEKKWPMLLEDPATEHQKKTQDSANPLDTGIGPRIQKDRAVQPGLKGSKAGLAWLAGLLTLLAAALAAAVIKNRLKQRK